LLGDAHLAMSAWRCAAWLAAAAAALLSGWVEAGGEAGRTAELTRASFGQFLENVKDRQRPCLVMFHVDWCKVCQRTFPKFANASELVHDKGLEMDFAHVDCTNDKSLCQRFSVKGYPTIKLFTPKGNDSEPRQYRGQRTEEFFLKFAERMTRPAVLPFSNAAALTTELKNETLATFLIENSGNTEWPAGLLAAAERWQDLHLFATAPHLTDLLPAGVVPPPGASLAVLSSGVQQWPGADNSTQPAPAAAFYSGSLDDVEEVGKWVEEHRFPGIWSLDASNFFFFTRASRRAVLVALDPADVSAAQERAIRETADRLTADFVFGILDGAAWAEELVDFNIARKDLPRILVAEDDFNAWIEDVEALRLDSLEADLKSLVEGAPLLRQDRSTTSKLRFYKREGFRLLLKVRAYAAQGPMQAGLVCVACLMALTVVAGIGWCMISCCRILLADDPEFLQQEAALAARARAERMKRD